jgi:hypothetical protein
LLRHGGFASLPESRALQRCLEAEQGEHCGMAYLIVAQAG